MISGHVGEGLTDPKTAEKSDETEVVHVTCRNRKYGCFSSGNGVFPLLRLTSGRVHSGKN
jgi:hypothetical protein